MQIRITDINTDKVVKALQDLGFGTVRTWCAVRNTLESVSIWTEEGPDGVAQGYEAGLMRRELTSFTRHELVLETNRVEPSRLMALLGRIASENR